MSLSRLMKDGIGEERTRADHQEISNQNYDAYSRSQEVRALAGIVGKAGLTEIDLKRSSIFVAATFWPKDI